MSFVGYVPVASGSNNLRGSTNYGWTWILSALVAGGRATTVNTATDAAIQAQKDAFSQASVVYYVLNFLATFNASISVPDLNQAAYQAEIGAPAPGFAGAPATQVSYNYVISGPASTLTFQRTSTAIWKAVLLVFQVIKGANYVPKDSEFDMVWSYFKGSATTFSIADMFNFVIGYLLSPQMNPGDAGMYLTDARSVTFNPQMDTPTITLLTAYAGLNYLMDPTLPAFTVTRLLTLNPDGSVAQASFSLKIRIKAYSNASNISVSNFGYLPTANPFQYVMAAASRDMLVGSVITIEANNYVASGLASNVGSDIANVAFVHVAFDPKVNNYLNLGFKVTGVQTVQFSGTDLLLVLTVVDSQTRSNSPTLQQTLSYVAPAGSSPSPPSATTPTVVVACSDPALEIQMNLVLSDLYTKPV